jgi:hypothetical protein
MIKYKSTLLSGLTVETVAPNMTEAVTHVEKWYSTYVIKCEIVDSTKEKQEKENDEIINDLFLKL